jgi:hypothetical protein
MKALAAEWATSGTRVKYVCSSRAHRRTISGPHSCLCPGYVATDQTSHMCIHATGT